MPKIEISGVEYDYTTVDKKILVIREDGARASYNDNENIVKDWEDWLIENVMEGNIIFTL
jgi:hypothetical protein